MPYSAMPSRLMPLDADGTVVGTCNTNTDPVSLYPSTLVGGWVNATASLGTSAAGGGGGFSTVCFFPETRTILGCLFGRTTAAIDTFQGSSDTTNGVDGTWEAASIPGGYPPNLGTTATVWRTGVAACTFASAKATVKCWKSGQSESLGALHLYGVKASGQTPDDILFLDGDTSFAEYTVDKDFGDRPLGTTVVKQFKLKNSSGTKTANTIVVTCNDADFAISNDGTTYGTTFTVTSLGAGVSSAVFYIRNTTPAPGAALGPRQVRLSAAVGSYT